MLSKTIRAWLPSMVVSDSAPTEDGQILNQRLAHLGDKLDIGLGTLANQVNGSENTVLLEIQRHSGALAGQALAGQLANEINRLENAVVAALQILEGAIQAQGAALLQVPLGLAAVEARMTSTMQQEMLKVQGKLDAQAQDKEESRDASPPTSAAVSQMHANVQDAIDRLEKGVVEGLEAQGTHFTELERALSVLPNGLAAIEARLTQAMSAAGQQRDGTAAALEPRIAALESAILALPQALAPGIQQRDAALDRLSHRMETVEQAAMRHPLVIAESESRILQQLGHGANQLNGAQNLILGALAENVGRIDQITARLDAIDRERERDARLATLLSRGIAALVNRPASPEKQAVVPPGAAPPIADQIAEFRRRAPLNIDTWETAFDRATEANRVTLEGNLSHDGHLGANYFRMFVNIHAKGRILDIGCGPLPMPEYLRDWPADQIAGMDPLAPFSGHQFPFARTFAETLPWPGASFETVVVGTSLDHFYLLDVALAEIKRVLKPEGRLLLWTGLLQETAAYDPYDTVIDPPDAYHLFHPGKNWFLGLLEPDYVVLERIESVASAELIALQRRPDEPQLPDRH